MHVCLGRRELPASPLLARAASSHLQVESESRETLKPSEMLPDLGAQGWEMWLPCGGLPSACTRAYEVFEEMPEVLRDLQLGEWGSPGKPRLSY